MSQTAPGIEFLDPDDGAPADRRSGRAGAASDDADEATYFGAPGDVPSVTTVDPALLGAIGMLAAATALCLGAAFQTLFTLRLGGPDGLAPGAYRVDGWGRYQALGPVFFLSPGHFTRYGIPVTVCGGVFAVLTVIVAVLAWRARTRVVEASRLSFVTGGAIAATAGLAGTFAAAVLQVQGLGDSTKDILTRQGVPEGFRTEFVLHFGPFFYLVVAGLLAGVLAVVSTRRLARYWTSDVGPGAAFSTLFAAPAQARPDLPAPVDDGAADHLPGRPVPPVRLPATDGTVVALDELPPGRAIVWLFPRSERPDVARPDGWDAIAGASGSAAQARDFRDHHGDLRAAGVAAVYGLSSQSVDYLIDNAQRLDLPFPLLSDPDLDTAAALFLPTFTADGRRWFRRLTLVLRDGIVEHAFYPVFPPDRHAQQVLDWLATHPLRATTGD